MKRMLVLLLAVGAMAAQSSAGVITVDCSGGADFTDLREAILAGSADDTLLVSPCTYVVHPGYPPYIPGWPVELTETTPTIIGVGGADVTIVEGDGTTSAFVIPASASYGRAHIHGVTFRNVADFIDREDYDVGCYFDFTDNVVEQCASGLNASSSAGVIARNIIRNNGGIGIYVYHNSGLIEDNEVCYNDRGISGPCCESPTIRGNHVHHNTLFGVAITFDGQVLDNVIEHNGTQGVRLFGYGTVEGNIIRNNNVGVYLYDGCSVSLHWNDIYDNYARNFAGIDLMSDCTLDATMNWWGTTDPEEIAAGILDRNEDPAIGVLVEFDPWCEEPGCEEPNPVQPTSWGNIKALYR